MIQTLDRIFKTQWFFWLRIFQFLLAIGIFTFVALMPANLIQTQQSDKLMHYLGNMLLFLSAYVAAGGRIKLWMVIALLIPYSIAIELSQSFTVSRHVDPKDAAANISGLITGFFIAYSVNTFWSRLKEKPNDQL